MYVKICLISAAITAVVGMLIYFMKPSVFRKVKEDKNSDLDMGMLMLACIGVFVVTAVVTYLAYSSYSGGQSAVPVGAGASPRAYEHSYL